MDPEKKIKFVPWAIEKSLTRETGSKPATLRSNNESEFVIEISNEEESKIIPSLKSLCSPEFQERIEVEIFVWNKINYRTALIYIHSRLQHTRKWWLWRWTKERVQTLGCAKSRLDKNQKHYFYSTATDFQRKRTILLRELHKIQKRNQNRPVQNKRTHTQTLGHTKTFRTKPKSWINLLKRSKKHLWAHHIKIPEQIREESQSDSSEDNSPSVRAYGHGYYTKEKKKGARLLHFYLQVM